MERNLSWTNRYLLPPYRGRHTTGSDTIVPPHSDDLADTDSGESDTGLAPDVQDEMEVPVIQAASADCLFLLNTTSNHCSCGPPYVMNLILTGW